MNEQLSHLIEDLSLDPINLVEGLRKAKAIAIQAKAKNIEDWVTLELFGYKKHKDILPTYRNIRCETYFIKRTFGFSKKISYKDVGGEDELDQETEIILTESKIIAGITELYNLYTSQTPLIPLK